MFWVVIIGNDHEFEDSVREVSKNKCTLVFKRNFSMKRKNITPRPTQPIPIEQA